MDLRKLAVNMIPFPSVHFLITSFSPLITRHSSPYHKHTEQTLVSQMFDRQYQMLQLSRQKGKYLTATGVFRGQSLSIQLLHDLLSKEKQKQAFVHWIANNVNPRRDASIRRIFHRFVRSVSSVKWHIAIFPQQVSLDQSPASLIIRAFENNSRRCSNLLPNCFVDALFCTGFWPKESKRTSSPKQKIGSKS